MSLRPFIHVHPAGATDPNTTVTVKVSHIVMIRDDINGGSILTSRGPWVHVTESAQEIEDLCVQPVRPS